MTNPFAPALRKHLHVLIVVPLVVIATTWPTFPRIFDADEFWLHVMQHDKWLKIWDVWHIERVLAGQAQLYFTVSSFHPHGLSLAYQAYVFPHALLLLVLNRVLPVDDAYNLLFLLILCFNAYCGYALVRHLIKDKWIALFGAVVFAVATPFPFGSTSADHIMIGTLPLTVYFLLRAFCEANWRLAGMAGICAGITAFISVYVFTIILLSFAILATIKVLSLWRQQSFWLGLLLFAVLCFSVSLLRFYPMLADRELLTQAVEAYQSKYRSNDVLQHFVLPNNPITGHLFGAPPDARDDNEISIIKLEFREAYLGYINIFLVACALLLMPRRRKLLPWIVILALFALLRLGSFLTFNGVEYTEIVLPEGLLRDWFPALFGNIANQEYYQIGVVMALAALSCFGLAALLRLQTARIRMFAVLFCTLVICIEFYVPRIGQTIEKEKTAFVAWLASESAKPIKLIQLPLTSTTPRYFHFIQTLTGYPQAYGFSSRIPRTASRYINGNLLLHSWRSNRNIHCLKHNEQSFTAALDQLLSDGFTHIVLHNWLYGDHFIISTFENVPAAYDDGYVSVYRVRDLRISCQNQAAELPRFIQFAQSPSAIPGARSAILSLHPSQPVNPDRFDYLASLFSDWASLLHLYRDDGDLAMQNAGVHYADLKAFTNDNQIIHFLYNTGDTDPDLVISQATFDQFKLCQREAKDDGAVIEHYVSREFSCELVASDNPFSVQYDNGIRLENIEVQQGQDVIDLQLWWSNLPDETHSVSIQLYDAAGAKSLGQDSVIGHVTLDRHQIDLSALPPGYYSVKLIVYGFHTGQTIAGTVSRDGERFDRELAIATMDRY